VLGRFHDEHERLYGYCYRDDPTQSVEWVNLRATGIGPITRPDVRELPRGDGNPGRARTGERDVYFEGAWHSAALYDRAGLHAGDEVRGPAVVEEYGSTLPLAPGFVGRVDGRANIVVRRERS
jgi:N-methylhydantoinase A